MLDIQQIPQIKDLKIKKGMKVLLRLDFNVPINDASKIVETFRIDESLATIDMLQKKAAKIIILAHRESGSLAPVAKYLKTKIKQCSFVESVVGERVISKIENMQDGEVLLLENVRSDDGEKKNDKAFAKLLASYGDVYINDAFSASHRQHASIVGVAKLLPSCLGPLFIKELTVLSKALDPKKPFLFILGGAKFDTKLGLLTRYVKVADTLFVGGALAHTFFKGYDYEIGTSLLDEQVKLTKATLDAHNIILPVDVEVADAEGKVRACQSDQVLPGERIVDFGQNTLELLTEIAKDAKTIVWNGPLGFYEKGFDKGTKGLLTAIGQMKGKTTILGGGDTVAVAQDLLKKDAKAKNKKNLQFTHISTGGGAMIDFLSKGTLPAIKVLKLKN